MSRKKTPRNEALFLANQLSKLTWLTFDIQPDVARSTSPETVCTILADVEVVRRWLDDISAHANIAVYQRYQPRRAKTRAA